MSESVAEEIQFAPTSKAVAMIRLWRHGATLCVRAATNRIVWRMIGSCVADEIKRESEDEHRIG